MIKLVVGNSMSKIQGLNLAELKTLRSLLSYAVDTQAIRFGGGYAGARRYLMDKSGNFPSGLLHTVKAHFEKTNTIHVEEDTRVPPNPRQGLFRLSMPLTPYSAQRMAVEQGLMRSGTISMPTGTGKSVTMAMLIYRLQLKTLVIVPNLGLKQQLTNSFKSFFGNLDNITVENVDSPRLKTLTDYDALIIDESHHVAAKTYRELNRKAWTGIYRRYFFTATPFRSRDEEQMLMESISGPVIYRLTYKEAVERGYIVPVEAFYYDLPKKEIKGNETSWPAMYSELVVNNELRNDLISCVLLDLHKAGKSTLCLVKEITHGNKLSLNGAFLFANGQDDNTSAMISRFNQEKIKILIGTVGVLGEGVDTKPAEYVVIAGLGKSKNSIMQQIGRAVRNYPGKDSAKVILFRDSSHKWGKSHFAAQVKILKDEYGVVPIKLRIM